MPDIYVASRKSVKRPDRPRKKQSRPVSQKKTAAKKVFGSLTAFMKQPDHIRFETQEKKEKIVLLLRRHWFTNLPWIMGTFLLILAPLFFHFLPFLSVFPWRFRFIGLLIWYMLTLAFAFEKFLSWCFNVNIVTDERIVDIDFYSLIYKEISHCKIDRIQDVTYRMGGVLRTLFDYGDVLIQTAGERPFFEFEAVPHPAKVVRKINDLLVEEEKEKLEGRVR